MAGCGWAPQPVERPQGPAPGNSNGLGDGAETRGDGARGKSRLVCTPSPLLLTVGPENLNLDPSWAISAECEAGAGGWHCGHPLPPGVPETSEPGELSVHELCSIAGP